MFSRMPARREGGEGEEGDGKGGREEEIGEGDGEKE